MQLTTMRHKQSGVSSCVRCGACEIKCPQSIPIRQKLQEAKKDLETPTYKVVKAGVKLLKMW
jgi:predicted aldo/keto reductase-like oxidoreductase